MAPNGMELNGKFSKERQCAKGYFF